MFCFSQCNVHNLLAVLLRTCWRWVEHICSISIDTADKRSWLPWCNLFCSRDKNVSSWATFQYTWDGMNVHNIVQQSSCFQDRCYMMSSNSETLFLNQHFSTILFPIKSNWTSSLQAIHCNQLFSPQFYLFSQAHWLSFCCSWFCIWLYTHK